MELNCVLFIPVSSPSGIGEYMRSMIIAKALKLRWPNVDIHFILNEKAAYINDCKYTVHTCKDSPTKEVSRVNALIEDINPELVIFDASGRAEQFKKAKKNGAKVAFISQHNKKRNRGLKLNRLFNTDLHWVAQPQYCMKALSYWQRIKLGILNQTAPKNIGPVFELSHQGNPVELLNNFSLTKDHYFIFNAGSGGHHVANILAADIYYQAAIEFSQKMRNINVNIKCVVLFGSNYPHEIPQNKDIVCLKNIDNKDFITLLSNAKGCIVSAGDTLLQCIALHKVCVAAPVSSDQPARLKLCQNKQLVFAAEPTVNSLVNKALLTLDDEACKPITRNIKCQVPAEALDVIINDISLLFPPPNEYSKISNPECN